MFYKNRKCTNPQEIVEGFADYFEQIYQVDDEQSDFNEIYGTEPADSKDIHLTMFDIEAAIKKLELKNNCGPDNLSPIVVKRCMDALIWPLWILYEKTVECDIPECLKYSRVVPVFKKGDKRNVENYRIVAISSVILCVYEIAMQSKLQAIIDPRLSNAQHGFRPGRSVTTNLLCLSIAAHEAFENSHQLDVFYGDFKNAFDKVIIRLLIEKLRAFGIGKLTARWLFNFLVERKFFVKIGDFVSRTYDDVASCIKEAMVLLFADDIKLACRIRSIMDTRDFQKDISNFMTWCDDNKQHLNLDKCSVITIRRTENFIRADYSLGDHIIQRPDEVLDLGIPIDRKMMFGTHTERISNMARQSLGYIKRISNGQFGMRALKVCYSSFVRSRLEFGSVIWNPHCQTYKDDLESVQKQFVMYALRLPPYRLPPYEERCKVLGLETLSDRRRNIDLMLAYDLYNGKITDISLSSKLIKFVPTRSLRQDRLVYEKTYRRDYSYFQPLERVAGLINKYAPLFGLNRTRFKSEIKRIKDT